MCEGVGLSYGQILIGIYYTEAVKFDRVGQKVTNHTTDRKRLLYWPVVSYVNFCKPNMCIWVG